MARGCPGIELRPPILRHILCTFSRLVGWVVLKLFKDSVSTAYYVVLIWCWFGLEMIKGFLERTIHEFTRTTEEKEGHFVYRFVSPPEFERVLKEVTSGATARKV
jgi:hypothetical protein